MPADGQSGPQAGPERFKLSRKIDIFAITLRKFTDNLPTKLFTEQRPVCDYAQLFRNVAVM